MKKHYEDDELSIREASLALDTSTHALAQVESLNWENVAADLHQSGNAVLKAIFTSEDCEVLAGLYGNDEYFRSRVVMSRHGFGRGEYKYFKYPLPDVLQGLRSTLYEKLAPIANDWNQQMGIEVATQPSMPISSHGATRRDSSGRLRCCCSMAPAITTACTRIFMESIFFRFR